MRKTYAKLPHLSVLSFDIRNPAYVFAHLFSVSSEFPSLNARNLARDMNPLPEKIASAKISAPRGES